MAARIGLLLLNKGNKPTFPRPGYRDTIPDVSFANEALARKVSRWKVLEDYTASNHQYITFNVHAHRIQVKTQQSSSTKWRLANLDKESFSIMSDWGMEGLEVLNIEGKDLAGALMEGLIKNNQKSCVAYMPRKGHSHWKSPVYWWTP
jgi:hypothetical protein